MCQEFVVKLPPPLGEGWGEGLATERKHLSPFLFERTEEAKEENLLLQLLNYALTQLSPKGRGSLPTTADTVLDRMRAAAEKMIGRLDHDSLLLLDSMKVRILRVIRIAYVLPKNQLTFLSDDQNSVVTSPRAVGASVIATAALFSPLPATVSTSAALQCPSDAV